jgi:RNA polymerase sigma factor (sigma-70 family)
MDISVIYVVAACVITCVTGRLIRTIISTTPAGSEIAVRLWPWPSMIYIAPTLSGQPQVRPSMQKTTIQQLRRRNFGDWSREPHQDAGRRQVRRDWNTQDDEDSIQEAFIDVLNHWPDNYEHKDDAVLRIILRKIINNERANIHRKRERERSAEEQYARENRYGQDAGIDHRVLWEMFDKFLDSLKSDLQTQIIQMHIKEEMSGPEIAIELGMNVNTVRSHIERAVKALRKETERMYNNDPDFTAYIDERSPRGRHRRIEPRRKDIR